MSAETGSGPLLSVFDECGIVLKDSMPIAAAAAIVVGAVGLHVDKIFFPHNGFDRQYAKVRLESKMVRFFHLNTEAWSMPATEIEEKLYDIG